MADSRIKALASLHTRANLLLLLFGCASLALYQLSLRAHSSDNILWFLKIVLLGSLLFLATSWVVLRARPSGSTFLIVVVFAALFRLSLLFAPPYLSDDIYRYVWDGRVQAAGINPYRYIPADPALAHLRDDQIYPRINRRDNAHTMYPPVAEGVWFFTTRVSESVTWMKTTMICFEAIAMWAIAQLLGSFGLPRQRIVLYAWHPLTVWEFAGSGHLDAIAIAFISLTLLARRRNAETATGLALASATLVKLFPAVLFAAMYKRGRWKMPLILAITTIVAYLPYLGVGPRGVIGFLPGYAEERGIVSGEQFFILAAARRLPLGFHIPTIAYIVFAILLLAVLAVWMVRKQTPQDDNYVTNSLILACTFIVLLAPHFPWYFAWITPFVCFVPSVAAIYLTLSSFLLYLTWIYWTDDQVFRIKAAIYIPFFFLVSFSLWKRREKLKTKLPRRRPFRPKRMPEQTTERNSKPYVSVIVAALNEEEALAQVIRAIPRDVANEIIVVDNGSTDRTAEVAYSAGAQVILELQRGYGRAYRAGLRGISENCRIVVFLDGDGSDYPEMMDRLVQPIIEGTHDFVIGSRTRGHREPGSMNLHQIFAGYMIGLFLRMLYGVRYTDMGPFRAIRRDVLERLRMREQTYGWPLEMQLKAARAGLRILEVPVDYRCRAGGRSKIAGTIRGSLKAATRILFTLVRLASQRQEDQEDS
ncbi:MAG TPA: glycosyltransferase [Pyrinomonadaceae bacterium]|jgi:hypothetical protein|nr:glycosyltransferase [Pyrinomonadaceae bacterium]